MTTAHRPTFNPARGGNDRGEGDLSKLSQQYSSKDMPSHLKLKYRQSGQGNEEDIRKKDLRRELEDKEREAVRERRAKEAGASSSKRPRLDEISQGAAIDADDPLCQPDSDSDDSDSDEDDTAALMAELERIKKERAAEKEEKEALEKEKQEKVRLDNILNANPLLNAGPSNNSGEEGGFKVKRRWDDDVVFRNCAKGLDERKKDSTFINDAIRSEFHKKFMDKYIK